MKTAVMVVVAAGAIEACAGAPGVVLSPPRTVSTPTDVGAAPMFAVGPSGTEAVAWVSAPGGGTDGRLYVSVDARPPIEVRDPLGPIEAHGESPPKVAYGPDGALNALYVVGKVVPGARFPLGALRFRRSLDGGAHWGVPVTVTDDSAFGSHNFHALHAGADGALYVAWLDGREGKSAAYVAHSTDGGKTWSTNRRVSPGEACPCCRTALATAPDGTLYVAWRAVLPGDVRDIVIARSRDHGETWSDPVRVHADDWVYNGCPHAGPAVQVDTAGAVHVAWWTGKANASGVYYARSDDGGRSFGPAIALGVARYYPAAHVQIGLGPRGTVIVAWDDATRRGMDGNPAVVVRVSRSGAGAFAAAQLVSADGAVAGFPVVGVTGDSVTIAWSEQTRAAAQRAARDAPDMRDPKAVMGLHAVGETQVVVRRGALGPSR